MELGTIEMDQGKAKEAADAYRAAVRERRNEEDAQLARAYRELARGQRLIKLTDALVEGGLLELPIPKAKRDTRYRDGRWVDVATRIRVPKLAVARADAEFAWTNGIERDGSLRIQGKQEVAQHNGRDVITFEAGTFEESRLPRLERTWGSFGRLGARLNALVPPVPPPLRPVHALGNYHVLWEVEEWQFGSSPPPRDPALLKHIGGDLYAVLAVWDLTEIERAVLSGRTPE